MRRIEWLLAACVVGWGASGCASRCTLTPVDTVSSTLDAWVRWDSSAAPHYEISVVLPWRELRARAAAARTTTSRIVLSASVVDACGEAATGQAWSQQLDVASYEDEEFFRWNVRLPTQPGAQRLTLALLLQGEAYGALWQRTAEIPGATPGGLLLEPLQFWQRGDDGAPTPHLGRYYDERSDSVRARSIVHDRTPMQGGTYAFTYRVRNSDGDAVVESTRAVPRRASRTSLEVQLPVEGLGRFVLEIDVREGTRLASTSATFDVGFADLAAWGDAPGGRELLDLVFEPEEVARLDAAPATERAEAWDALWRARDPDPSTERNEFREAVRERVRLASARFADDRPGWQTDRGRVYIAWGAPEHVEAFQSPNALDRIERWTYDGGETVFVFVDVRGTGRYVLKRTNATEFLKRLRAATQEER